jgi:hypothetical protein
MKKIKLDLDSLTVDTFETTRSDQARSFGTVFGQSIVPNTGDCGDTMLATCNPYDAITCGGGSDCEPTDLTDGSCGEHTCVIGCTQTGPTRDENCEQGWSFRNCTSDC